MACPTPVAFIIFRRPDLTRRVFEAIRQARPAKLFVIADGPRTPEEAALCAETRAVTERVDWPCEVIRDYADRNLGCRRRVASGLDRVFEQVEEAIILEDDCLPDPSFFGYCTELLGRYRREPRIVCISGDNFQRGVRRGGADYYFSNYPHTWGWATWRRAWAHYDHEMAGWPALRDARALGRFLDDPLEVKYWTGVFETLASTGRPDTWDYVWIMSCWAHGGLTVLPNVNLVANIGFGAAGTNTKSSGCWIESRSAEAIGPLVHPAAIIRDAEADRFTFDQVFGGIRLRKMQSPLYRLRKKLWTLKQRLPARGRPE